MSTLTIRLPDSIHAAAESPSRRDLADAPTLAPHTPFDTALRTFARALDTARALFLSDWRQNEEITGILAPYLPA